MTTAQVYVNALMQSLAGENVEITPQLQQIFSRILSRQVTVDETDRVEEPTGAFDSLSRVFTYVAVTNPDERPPGGPFGYSPQALEQAKRAGQDAVNGPNPGEDDRENIDLFDLDGTLTTAESFDAGDGAFNLIDDVAIASNTDITGFGSDDQLTFNGVDASDIDVSVSDGNTVFQFDNGTGTVSQVTLVGVEGFFTSVEEFNANSDLGDIVFG